MSPSRSSTLRARQCSRRSEPRRARAAACEFDIDFDSWVAARIENFASPNFADTGRAHIVRELAALLRRRKLSLARSGGYSATYRALYAKLYRIAAWPSVRARHRFRPNIRVGIDHGRG